MGVRAGFSEMMIFELSLRTPGRQGWKGVSS